MARASTPITKIPIKLKKKEIGINTDIFALDRPRRLIPSSSGKGEAIRRPPARKVNHLKYFNLSKALILRHPFS